MKELIQLLLDDVLLLMKWIWKSWSLGLQMAMCNMKQSLNGYKHIYKRWICS